MIGVFPCGSEIGLEIFRSFDFPLLGLSSVEDGCENVQYIPDIKHSSCIEEIRKLNLEFLYPAHDSVIYTICQTDIPYIGSSKETCMLTRFKSKVYDRLRHFIPIPENAKDYPFFMKPDVGQGGRGCYLAENKNELDFYLKKDPSLLVLEYLPGEEYTIDCFTDYNGNLRVVSPRLRKKISNGISVNTITLTDKVFNELAEIINSKIEFNGAWYFQVKKDIKRELKLLEVSPRIAGSSCATRLKGVNLPYLSYLNQKRIPVDIIMEDFEVEVNRCLDIKFIKI